VAWDHVYEAAKQELNLEIGTAEHTAAVAARVEACGRLAREIYAAGGPKELAAFVMTPPQPQAGTASGGTVHRVTAPDRKAMKKAPEREPPQLAAFLFGCKGDRVPFANICCTCSRRLMARTGSSPRCNKSSVIESAADDLARDLGTAALNPKKISALRREDNAE
jgi:hypothetical protein